MQRSRTSLPARLPGLLSRDDFLALVGLDVEALNSLRRRDQLPQRPPRELPAEWADARGWSAHGALALIMALELADRYELSRKRAAEIAAGVYRTQARWADIATTSRQVTDGREPDFDIVYASVDLPGVRPTKKSPDPTIAVGTVAEIAAKHPTATGLIGVSVTRCAALMRRRAARAKIDLSDFLDA
jgi:hypothetical protein